MRVLCSNVDCTHCCQDDFHCTKEWITVGEEYDEGCNSYENYLDTEEYSEKYKIRVTTKDGRTAKAVKYHGKPIEYKGRTFFTSEMVRSDGMYRLTDKDTGMLVGMFSQLEDRFSEICRIAKDIPSVEELPLAEWDNGGYVIVEG